MMKGQATWHVEGQKWTYRLSKVIELEAEMTFKVLQEEYIYQGSPSMTLSTNWLNQMIARRIEAIIIFLINTKIFFKIFSM